MHISGIDKYWRVANYLTVALMYLEDNIFLERELSIKDIKDHCSGHWGTAPGINFLWAHLNAYIIKTHRFVQVVVGAGHAGNAILTNLLLDGSLLKYYPEFYEGESINYCKINQLIKKLRTENSPFLPGSIYDGGELGYALGVAFSSILDRPEAITVCIIGDGELKTGSTA